MGRHSENAKRKDENEPTTSRCNKILSLTALRRAFLSHYISS
jgi:hypothetical protein